MKRNADYGLVTAPILGGVERLAPEPMVVNSQLVPASVQLVGNDGDAAAKTIADRVTGATLVEAGSGASPTFGVSGPGRPGECKGITFPGAKYLTSPNTTTGNVGTHDTVDVVAFKATGTTSVIAAKRNAGVGWEIGIDASDRLYKTIQDASGSVTVVSAALTIGANQLGVICSDRNGSAQIYLQGAASGAAVDISARALTLDAAVAMTLGADGGGAGLFDSTWFYFTQYHAAAWLNSHLQPTLATLLTSIFAHYLAAHGHASLVPTLPTRTSAAYTRGF